MASFIDATYSPDSRREKIKAKFSGLNSIWTVVAASVILGTINTLMYGDLWFTVRLVIFIYLVVLSVLRPHYGFLAYVVLSLATEQMRSELFPYPWLFSVQYHQNLNNIFPSWSLPPISSGEIHLAAILFGVLLRFLILRDRFMPVMTWKWFLVYSVGLAFFIIYGISKGGTFLPALWEVRGIGYFIILMVVVPQIARTRRQIENIVWAALIGVWYRAFEMTFHFVAAGFGFEGSNEGWGSHEDAGFIVTVLVLMMVMYVMKFPHRRQKLVANMMILPCMLGIVSADRRSAYPILIACLAYVTMLLSDEVLKRMFRWGWKFGILFVLYLGVFWNTQSTSILFAPVRNVREGIAGSDAQAAGGSYTSNLYRDVENHNMFKMIAKQPVLGSGYGVPLDYSSLPLPVLWDLGFYIAHNQIIGVLVKTGLVGFIIFMIFYLTLMSELAHGFSTIVKDPYYKVILVFAGIVVIDHLVYAFFDIVLTYYRNNVYLGALLGVSSSILHLEKEARLEEERLRAAETAKHDQALHPIVLQEPEKRFLQLTS